MRRVLKIAAVFLLASFVAETQAQAQAQPAAAAAPDPIPAVMPSSFASEEIHFAGRVIGGTWFPGAVTSEGPARIRITYGQPHSRGRKIVGGVVPLDSVWRVGANLATELEADADFTLGGTLIPRGLYTLFVLPSANGWQLIVSRQNFEWGTDYDASADFARIPLHSRNLADPIESLSIYLIPTLDAEGAPATNPHGVIKFMWERTELSANWKFGK